MKLSEISDSAPTAQPEGKLKLSDLSPDSSADVSRETQTFGEGGRPMAPLAGGPGAHLTPPNAPAGNDHIIPSPIDLVNKGLRAVHQPEINIGQAIGAGGEAFGGLGPAPALVGRAATPVMQGAADLAGKGIATAGKGASHALGLSTGAGAEAVQQAAKAGYEGGQTSKTFLDNLRQKVDLKDVVKSAREAVGALRNVRATAYKAGIEDIKKDATTLDFDEIDQAITKASAIGNFHGVPINEAADKAVNKAADLVRTWKASPPEIFHTADGLDGLKQAIGNIRETLPYEEEQARLAINNSYHAAKDTIMKQAPAYGKVMKDYEAASEELRELEKGMSMGKQATIDTALKKLQSIMRNNAAANYGNRLNMVKTLEEKGGQKLRPALAGQALSSPMPRGIVGQGAGLVTGSAALTQAASGNLGHAAMLAAGIPLESPRAVGEMAHLFGIGAGKARDILRYLGVAAQ